MCGVLVIHKPGENALDMHIIAQCLTHIDTQLTDENINYLCPPLPANGAQWEEWTTYRPLHGPPLVPRWIPPCVDTSSMGDDAGFLLNEKTECFQRGYCPSYLYDEIIDLYADGFHHSSLGMRNGLKDLVYDFILVIRAQTEKGKEVAAACMVEFRCSNEENAIPYLFIYELVTKPTYGRHGLAQQLVHATDALAYLMTRCSQTNPTSIWRESLKGRRFFLALTVDVTQAVEYWKSLVKLYSRCGMYARRSDTPKIDYRSFSPYADASYCIENTPNHYLPMFKEAMPNVVYSDGVVSIAVKGDESRMVDGCYTLFYYIVSDRSKLALIKKTGLEAPSHRCLYSEEVDAYIAPSNLIFYRQRPAAAEAIVFAVMAVCDGDTFEVRSSLPSWFAVFIGAIGEMPRLMV